MGVPGVGMGQRAGSAAVVVELVLGKETAALELPE